MYKRIRKRYKLPEKKGTIDKWKQVLEDEEPFESLPPDSFWDEVISGEEDVFEHEGDDATGGYQPYTTLVTENIEGAKLEREPENSQELVSCSQKSGEEENVRPEAQPLKFMKFKDKYIASPQLELWIKFSFVKVFREAVREVNIHIGKDLH